MDTGVFDKDRYFDVYVEYAKGGTEDILVRISVSNRGPETASLHLLPTLWFRNTWTWNGREPKPCLYKLEGVPLTVVEANHHKLGKRRLYCEGKPELLFTENETNQGRLHGVANGSHFVKDGINDAIVHGIKTAVNPAQAGTKVAAHYPLTIGPRETITLRLRFTLTNQSVAAEALLTSDFDRI